MGIMPKILFGRVMHGRLFPRRNNFSYGIYYLSIPLSQIDALPIAYNRFSAFSFHDKDHGNFDGSDLEKWARHILSQYKINEADGEITLICMPRIFGYVFNPVSFWLCHDKKGEIRAVLCEVHNTFGEHHTYICAHSDQRPIIKNDTLKAEKIFHVSPFLERAGHYTFRFDIQDNMISAWIDFYNAENKKQLVTSLRGNLSPMTKKNLRKAFFSYPLVTLKAIILIHWQAIKLVTKGIKYISKPSQKPEKTSAAENLTKM